MTVVQLTEAASWYPAVIGYSVNRRHVVLLGRRISKQLGIRRAPTTSRFARGESSDPIVGCTCIHSLV